MDLLLTKIMKKIFILFGIIIISIAGHKVVTAFERFEKESTKNEISEEQLLESLLEFIDLENVEQFIPAESYVNAGKTVFVVEYKEPVDFSRFHVYYMDKKYYSHGEGWHNYSFTMMDSEEAAYYGSYLEKGK